MMLPHFYETPPDYQISLPDFIEYGQKRKTLLKTMMQGKKPAFAVSPFKSAIEENASHFIMRLACCRDAAIAQWFIEAECKLLHCKLDKIPTTASIDFLSQQRHIHYELASKKELETLFEQFLWQDDRLYKIPFHRVGKLIASRQVLLKHGVAYVTEAQFVQVVLYHYRTYLEEEVQVLRRASQVGICDERVQVILNDLSKDLVDQSIVETYHTRLRPDEIDEVISTHCFPLCMRELHEKLVQNNHLKYDGRVQYRLFLKGAGFSIDDSLKFWRNIFTKGMSTDTFRKKYAYNIRHTYGLEGCRKSYEPLTCTQIINGSYPNNGQYHGCPFKHWDVEYLKYELEKYYLPAFVIQNILNSVGKKNYQESCVHLFRHFHPSLSVKGVGASPNKWLELSLTHYSANLNADEHNFDSD